MPIQFFHESDVPLNAGETMPFNRGGSRRSHGTFASSLRSAKSLEVFGEQPEVKPEVCFQESREKLPVKPTRKRLVEKNGQRNVRSRHVPRNRYAQDIFTTVIDARWKWVIILCVLSYLLTWLFFGTMWWMLIYTRGPHVKCLDNIKTWTEAFLYSVETQQTIGYGTRELTPHCPEAVILLLLQTITGMILDALLLGLVFAKISRPGKRATTIIFSENCVITLRDGKMCLMFQVGDLRKRQLLEAHVRLYLFRSICTEEGRMIPFYQESLKVGHDHRKYDADISPDRLFLIFPITVIHIIDETSPFYDMSQRELENSDWELVPILEGVVEATGSTVQARTSFLGDEIMWGQDFVDIVDPDEWSEEEGLRYRLSKVNLMYPVNSPVCSPKEYHESKQMRPCSSNRPGGNSRPQSNGPVFSIEEDHDEST